MFLKELSLNPKITAKIVGLITAKIVGFPVLGLFLPL